MLHELIKEGKIEFYNQNKKITLDAFLEKEINTFLYNKYPDIFLLELGEYLTKTSSEYLTIKGEVLEDLLQEAPNIDEITNLMTSIHIMSLENEQPIRLHLALDYKRIDFEQVPFQMFDMFYGTNVAQWAPRMNHFEKCWNVSILAQMMASEYPGYAWPERNKEFDEYLAKNAQYFVLGTMEQLKRYKEYAEKFPDYKEEVEKTLSGFLNLPN